MSLLREDKLLNVDNVLHKIGIGENMTVVDLGCGSGYFVFPISKIIGKNGKVYAIDIIKKNLESIKRKAHLENCQNIETVWANIEVFNGSKLESGSIDAILIINTLHQSKHKATILREANRLAVKGGIIVIIDWKKISLPFGPSPEDRVDTRHVIQMAHKLGLTLEEEFSAGKYHNGLIFQKI